MDADKNVQPSPLNSAINREYQSQPFWTYQNTFLQYAHLDYRIKLPLRHSQWPDLHTQGHVASRHEAQ